MEKFVLIDANALLHRAFHALPPLTTKAGQPTGALYGFLLTLLKVIKELQPRYIAACFDTKEKTFRHEQLVEYKANRPVTNPALVSQIPLTKYILKSFNIPIFEKEGYEADDLIATICKQCEKNQQVEIYILTGDFDNLQLVNERVKVYILSRGIKEAVIYDINKVKEKFKVDPSQIIDLKALTGDVSDNIPGVKGIGEKTASQIIQVYGSLENLYQELATDTAVLKKKIKKLLKENKEKVFLARNLIKMRNDVPIDFNLKDCQFGGFKKEEIEEKFRQLEFNSLLNRIPFL